MDARPLNGRTKYKNDSRMWTAPPTALIFGIQASHTEQTADFTKEALKSTVGHCKLILLKDLMPTHSSGTFRAQQATRNYIVAGTALIQFVDALLSFHKLSYPLVVYRATVSNGAHLSVVT